jgi:hypothetical protein
METIRSMLLYILRQRNDLAAEKLAKRFERTKILLDEVRSSEAGLGDEIYDESVSDELLKSDEITAAEFYFMEGREGTVGNGKKRIMTPHLLKHHQKNITMTNFLIIS